MNRLAGLLVPLFLAACGDDLDPHKIENAVSVPFVSSTPAAPTAWRSAPAEGVEIVAGDTVWITTGPHAVAWPSEGDSLQPPYTIEATLQKQSGHLYEGYGLVIGGTPLDAPEAAQQYSYFLIRGDGSFLIKRRDGADTPVVRNWTSAPAIVRDEAGGQPNTLGIDVGADEVVFRANGVELARVPTDELHTRGQAGVRIAHGVRLAVTGFREVSRTIAEGGKP